MSVQQIIPAYVYSQYADDDDIQAFNIAFNAMAQAYLNTFLTIGLPLYPNLASGFLDWVATGLYGYPRPVLPSGSNKSQGALNTHAFNTKPALGGILHIGPTNAYVTSDDVYIRCLNWHFFKGDGKVFNIQWLKRRVARFLWGAGAPATGSEFTVWDFDVSHLYQISVTFGNYPQVNINILKGIRTNIKGAVIGRFAFNTKAFNHISSSFVAYKQPALAPVLAAAINAGVLELPFQYTYVVTY